MSDSLKEVLTIEHNGLKYIINNCDVFDLSIPNHFSGYAPTFYDSPQPTNSPFASSQFIGDVKQGGSCNVPVISLNIHCNGTHTECEGHINDSGLSIIDVCPLGFIPAYIISVDPECGHNTSESYHVSIEKDLVITKKSIEGKIDNSQIALIIRTNPNDVSKKSRNYNSKTAPFFTHQAIDYIMSKGVKHLLVDLPSIDRANDGGHLGNHKRFFKYGKTISELLFIDNALKDGFGFLNIQIPNWSLDAAPSRPIFYKVWFSFLLKELIL